jgi:tripartite-type tricarboxylate transporter receptor subunit TctC
LNIKNEWGKMGKLVIRITIIFGVVFLFALSDAAKATDTYPVKPIIFIVPNEAGSSADTMARALDLGYDIPTYSSPVALGPPKMPKEITDKLGKTIESAANDPEFKALLAQNNALPLYLPPDQAIKWFDEQRKLYRDIMDKAGILKEK